MSVEKVSFRPHWTVFPRTEPQSPSHIDYLRSKRPTILWCSRKAPLWKRVPTTSSWPMRTASIPFWFERNISNSALMRTSQPRHSSKLPTLKLTTLRLQQHGAWVPSSPTKKQHLRPKLMATRTAASSALLASFSTSSATTASSTCASSWVR